MTAPGRAAAPASDRGGQADHDDEVAQQATAPPSDHPRTLWRVRWARPGRARRGHVYVAERDARAAVARLEAAGATVELHRTDAAVSWIDPADDVDDTPADP